MKRVPTISLESVKVRLRRSDGSRVENHQGWSVFVDDRGQQFYVMDDEEQKPVPFYRVSSLTSYQRHRTVSVPFN